MSGTFGSLSMALSALYAQRRGMDVAGHNIANANTEGYSRQRVDMRSVGGPAVPAIHSIWTGAGAGVTVDAITRLRDAMVEARGRSEHSRDAQLSGIKGTYTQIELAFAEPSDTALQSQLDDFWAGWHDVANQPGDLAARSQLLQRGRVVADGLHAAYGSLSSQWTTSRMQLDAYATEVNTTAATVAELNQAIQRAQAVGLPANEMADQRDVHLMRLAELVGSNAVARDDGTVDVFLAGSALVNGSASREIRTAGAGDLTTFQAAMQSIPPNDTAKVRLEWADSPAPIVVSGGHVAAGLEALDQIVPSYATRLDSIAAELASSVNAAHQGGYDLDGNTNKAFFTGTTARTIGVALGGGREVAASGRWNVKPDGSIDGGLDGSNADALAAIGLRTTGADASYREMVVALGVASQSAGRRSEIQSRVTLNTDDARLSEAGVNLDEEMTNMLAFQRAYEAASRVLTTIDQALDQLINRTGVVGR